MSVNISQKSSLVLFRRGEKNKWNEFQHCCSQLSILFHFVSRSSKRMKKCYITTLRTQTVRQNSSIISSGCFYTFALLHGCRFLFFISSLFCLCVPYNMFNKFFSCCMQTYSLLAHTIPLSVYFNKLAFIMAGRKTRRRTRHTREER